MTLHQLQTDALLRPIVAARVSKDGKGFSHVQAYDVRRRLTEIFGFGGWSGEVLDLTPIFETEKDGKWTVAYRCTYRLTVGSTVYTEAAMGDSKNQPSRADAHDMALKTAESQAFKRAAVNWGSQMGLSLYDAKNQHAPIIRYVLGDDPARINDDGTITRPEAAHEADTTDHVKAPVAPETPAPQAATPSPAGRDTDSFRDRALEATTKPKLARLLLEATTAGVAGSTTTDSDGAEVVLADLINARIKKVA